MAENLDSTDLVDLWIRIVVTPLAIPLAQVLVTKTSSPTIWTSAEAIRQSFHPPVVPDTPSSMLIIGYLSHHGARTSAI